MGIWLLGVLIINMLVVVLWGMFLILWLDVCHVLVVGLSICESVILLGRGLCFVILLGVRR